ncbi:MAG: transcriptional regulator [Candidatus Dormiibacter spiritus]|nr:MAG: transcriptional regulator [Candidatus Dormibacteraeota bacterium]
MVPELLLEEAARRFALLGDPSRLRLLNVLHDRGELAVGEIAVRTDISRENASQHLTRLAAAGLIARRRRGTSVFYRVDDATLAEICALICRGVRTRASALAGS